MDLKVLGKGSNGFVVFPSIDRIPNMVSKVSSETTLEEEFQNINLLPEVGPYKINKNVTIKRVPNELKELLPEYKNYLEDFYYMNIPFVDGKMIQDYFSHDGLFLGSLEEIHVHLELLLNLRDEINFLNKEYGVKHGDIQSCNIIYSEIDNRMYLIDFGLTRMIDNEDEEGQDDDLISFDYNILNEYLNSLLNTKIGYNWIVAFDICKFYKQINDYDIFKFKGDFLESINYKKVGYLMFNPNKEEIIDKVNIMLKDKPTYKRDEEIHKILFYPYTKPSYKVDEINIDNLRRRLNR